MVPRVRDNTRRRTVGGGQLRADLVTVHEREVPV